MTSSLLVAIVQGGPSSEAEVSRASAKSVEEGLRAAGHQPLRLELNGYLPEALRTGGFDVVFPIAHGAVGEDGSLQGLLEVLDLPYVGSDVLASALAMNKVMAKKLFGLDGIPVARSVTLPRSRGNERRDADRVLSELGTSVVVKPSSAGSAIGVTRLPTADASALQAAIAEAWAVDSTALVETFIRGREVTCGVLDVDGHAVALPPTEILAPMDAFYTYEARYAAGRSKHVCPAELGSLSEFVQDLAVRAHRSLGCRDLSRVDFVVGHKEADVVVLEVNTLPGFTSTSLYPEAAQVHGISWTDLCHRLVSAALTRGATARNAARPFPK